MENICGSSSVTVMVYSASTDPELLVRCMRAGAREFLTQPIAPEHHRRGDGARLRTPPAARPAKKVGGKLLVFLGAKGGSGVTTIASNFAVALAQESDQNTVLIDLDLPLGDAALDLGITAEFSTANALQNFERLDSNFFTKLLTKHSSGFRAGGSRQVHAVPATDEAVDKLLAVARQDFEYRGSRCRIQARPGTQDALLERQPSFTW